MRVAVVFCTTLAVLVTAAAWLAFIPSVPTRGLTNAPPAFLDDREHGFDPFISLCKTQGQTAFTTQNVNLIQHDGVVQVGSNNGCLTPQNEPTLAVNPVDPQKLVAGANDYRLCCDTDQHNDGTGWAYSSGDGGLTWRNKLLPALTRETGGWDNLATVDSAGDPSLAYAPDGKSVYYANIVFSRTDLAASGIVLSTSNNDGVNWLRPKIVYWTHDRNIFNDKEWIAVAPDGRIVITWTRFKADGFLYTANIWQIWSYDGGQHWTKARPLSDFWHPFNQGSQPVFAPDGTLYVPAETASAPVYETDATVVYAEKPNGARYIAEVGRVYDEIPYCFVKSQDGRGTLTDEQFRTSSMPTAAVDPSTGDLAVAWVDGEQGCHRTHTNAQVKLVYAHLAGTKLVYSPVQTVTSGGDKAFPAIAYRNGVTTVGFYTRDYATDGVSLDYAYASSGDSFVEHRLSDGSSNPFEQFKGAFIGDYTSLVVGGDGVVHAVWTDSRGGDQNILTQAFTPEVPVGSGGP